MSACAQLPQKSIPSLGFYILYYFPAKNSVGKLIFLTQIKVQSGIISVWFADGYAVRYSDVSLRTASSVIRYLMFFSPAPSSEKFWINHWCPITFTLCSPFTPLTHSYTSLVHALFPLPLKANCTNIVNTRTNKIKKFFISAVNCFRAFVQLNVYVCTIRKFNMVSF